MSISIIDAQRDILLGAIRTITQNDWKVLVLDPDSRRLMDNVIEQDAILNENITNIEQITERRQTNRDVDAVYLLTPQSHIVDCLMADLGKKKYRKAHIIFTSLLHPALRDRLDKSQTARSQIAMFRVLNIEFFPRESHLVTFRDPWSFPILFHPACSNLVKQHMEDMAQKIVGVCVALGEYPIIRYYRPRTPTHEASVLCSHLARFVQDELDLYAKFHEDFPPSTSRPRGTLYIVDRSMDLYAPILHEFTYQAMAHDLLPIKEGDRISYRTVINQGQPNQEEKDVEISEKDKIWIENRHRHMAQTIEKLMADFQKFLSSNPNFTNSAGDNSNSLNAIKDMIAGLPQFQEQKEAYALHLSMAQESMNRFQNWKLPDLALIEQILATGLDEDYKKPKGIASQIVRMLDEEEVTRPDRLRLLILYLLYKDGILPADLQKLLAHAELPPQDAQTVRNLELIGAHTARGIKDTRPVPPPLFPKKIPQPSAAQEEYSLSRYAPALQTLLENHASNTLDHNIFPYTKPPLDLGDEPIQASATSLRSAKPTWAKTRTNTSNENRQRVIVFAAGGATYSEARACYEVGAATNRDIFLVTSHMLTPSFFVRQVGDLSTDKRRLNIPMEMPKPKAPAHLFEPDAPANPHPQQQQQPGRPHAQSPQPPTQAMQNISLNGRANGQSTAGEPPGKLSKDPEKKKRHHFGFGKKS